MISSRIFHHGDHHARAGRVRKRIQATEADISAEVLNEFIHAHDPSEVDHSDKILTAEFRITPPVKISFGK